MTFQQKPILTLRKTMKFNPSLNDSLTILELSNRELAIIILETLKSRSFMDEKYKSNNYLELDESIITSNLPNLRDHLYKQLPDVSITDEYIIESLDHNGFFTDSTSYNYNELDMSIKESLLRIQSLDPKGVGALNSIDAIKIQCQDPLVTAILDNHSADLENGNIDKIAKTLSVSEKDIQSALNLMRTKTPFPCANFDTGPASHYIKPDIEVTLIDKKLNIEVLDYFNLNLLDQLDPKHMEALQETKTLIRNINRRNASLTLIMNELCKIQYTHFLFNDELVPCTQLTLAQNLGLSPSTVSRALNEKYFSYNSKAYPISSLLSSKLSSGQSSDSLKSAIKLIIEDEDPNTPLTDAQIQTELESYSIKVAIRTISKYRTQLSIPTFGLRKIK